MTWKWLVTIMSSVMFSQIVNIDKTSWTTFTFERFFIFIKMIFFMSFHMAFTCKHLVANIALKFFFISVTSLMSLPVTKV